MSPTASTFGIGLALLFPATQLVRFLDGIAVAIDPRLSVVGALHQLLGAGPGVTLIFVAALVGTAWVARRARESNPITVSALAD